MKSPFKIAPLLFCTLIFGVLLINQFAPASSARNSSVVIVANAGPDLTVYAGEPVRLDGTNSVGYSRESLADGTWSTRWTTGDGYDVENLVKAPHVYMQPGVYTAQLTIRDTSGVFTDTATVRVLPINSSVSQTLVDTGNPETNKVNLQAALNTAALNPASNEIVVPAGFVANDPIILPARDRSLGTYVTVRTSDLSSLPPMRRVTVADRSKLFKIDARPAGVTGYNQAIVIGLNSNYFRFVGMEITRSGELGSYKTDLIAVDLDNATTVEARPSHLIFDRVLLDARETFTTRAFAPNSEFTSLLNSSILSVRTNGTETKAIGQWTGNGPLAVVNNRLEAAAINFLVGGAPVTFPSEILDGLVFRGNHSWKDPRWIGPNGESIGSNIKNLWELKCGHNIIAEGNIFENNYADGQSGEAILIKSAAQDDSSNPYAEVSGVDFRNNKILNTRAGFSIVGVQSWVAPHPPYANHIRFVNNFWQMRSGRGNMLLSPEYFELNHNTFISGAAGNEVSLYQFLYVEQTLPAGQSGDRKVPGLKIVNNLSPGTYYGGIFSSYGQGTAALNYGFSSWDVRSNAFSLSPVFAYPTGNFFPSDYEGIFANYIAGDFSLPNTSAYRTAATDGRAVGADMAVIALRTNGAMTGTWSIGTDGSPFPAPAPVDRKRRVCPQLLPGCA